jgi:cell division protein FtsB
MRAVVKAGLAVIIFLGAAYFFVFPARTYLAQKSSIALEQRTISVLRTENSKLAHERRDLNRDATVQQIAREDYGLVKPGQQAFMVLPSPALGAPAPTKAPQATHHWYTDLEVWRFF